MEYVETQLVIRKADNVHRGRWISAHRVDVAQTVGRGNLSVQVGIIDQGRKEVERLQDQQVVAQAEDPGIARTVGTDQKIGVLEFG